MTDHEVAATTGDAEKRLDRLLARTAEALEATLNELVAATGPDPSRKAADIARLTAAVLQLVRAHGLLAAPAAEPPGPSATLAAILAELDAEDERYTNE